MKLYSVLVLSCIAASSPAGVAQRIPQDETHDFDDETSSRHLQTTDAKGPDGSCHLFVSTKPVPSGTSSKGVLVPIQSDDEDDDGVVITGFGFHIEPLSVGEGKEVDYEVYVLNIDGYYASPERSEIIPGMISDDLDPSLSFDYRGEQNIGNWTKIAEGQISAANLTQDSTTLSIRDADYYQIPLGTFKEAVPPNGGIRSFYLATKQSSMIYSNPRGDQTVNDEADTLQESVPGAPKILVGEGTVGYIMPNEPMLYQPKLFVGKVYYEKECPSLAPSKSSSPSYAPTVTASYSPSISPTITPAPTSAPSIVESFVPSAMPSEEKVEQIEEGLMVSMAIPCSEGDTLDDLDDETKNAMTGSVQSTAAKANTDPNVSNIQSKLVGIKCLVTVTERHLVGTAGATDASFDGRRLPTTSSAMDFSMVITGEYRPPKLRPGETAPPREPPNLGALTEDSINRDPEAFVKDLKDRAGEASPLAEVEVSDVKAQSFEIPEGADPAEVAAAVTKPPTARPTSAPTIVQEDNDSVLIIGIVVVAGIIAVLGSFLLYKHGERRAAKTRREKMARLEDEKYEKGQARMESRQRAKWEEANKRRHAAGNKEQWSAKNAAGGPPAQYPPTMAYPPPPPYGYPAYPPQPPPGSASYGGPPPPPYGYSQGTYPQATYAYPPQPPPPGPGFGQPPPSQQSSRTD